MTGSDDNAPDLRGEYPEGAVVRVADMGPVERAYAEAEHENCESEPKGHPLSDHEPWSGGDLDGVETWDSFTARLARHGLALTLAATPSSEPSDADEEWIEANGPWVPQAERDMEEAYRKTLEVHLHQHGCTHDFGEVANENGTIPGFAPSSEPSVARIWINRAGFTIERRHWTTDSLRSLPTPPVPDDHDLYRVVPGEDDRLVDGGIDVFDGLRIFTFPRHVGASTPSPEPSVEPGLLSDDEIEWIDDLTEHYVDGSGAATSREEVARLVLLVRRLAAHHPSENDRGEQARD